MLIHKPCQTPIDVLEDTFSFEEGDFEECNYLHLYCTTCEEDVFEDTISTIDSIIFLKELAQ